MSFFQRFFMVAWLAHPAVLAHSQSPHDAIYSGGDIVTVDDKNPTAEAIAVKDSKIVTVGDKASEFLGHHTYLLAGVRYGVRGTGRRWACGNWMAIDRNAGIQPHCEAASA